MAKKANPKASPKILPKNLATKILKQSKINCCKNLKGKAKCGTCRINQVAKAQFLAEMINTGDNLLTGAGKSAQLRHRKTIDIKDLKLSQKFPHLATGKLSKEEMKIYKKAKK